MSRWGNHPPCPRGCGELADECACPKRRTVAPRPEPVDDYDDGPSDCKISYCTDDASSRGYCDFHYERGT